MCIKCSVFFRALKAAIRELSVSPGFTDCQNVKVTGARFAHLRTRRRGERKTRVFRGRGFDIRVGFGRNGLQGTGRDAAHGLQNAFPSQCNGENAYFLIPSLTFRGRGNGKGKAVSGRPYGHFQDVFRAKCGNRKIVWRRLGFLFQPNGESFG